MSTLTASAHDSFCEPLVASPLRGARLLVVEPEPDRAMSTGALLARRGADCTVVRTVAGARRELDAGEVFDGALVDLGCDEHGATRLLARLRLASTPCLGIILAPMLEAEGSRQLLVRGAFEVVQRPVGRDVLVAAAERVVRGTVQLRTNVCVRPRMPPHAGPLESAGRRAKFELRGAVSALSLEAKLTPRESGVLRFIAMGYRYTEIADELSITVRTVKMHAANVRKKSGAKDRYALLRMLLERGA